VGVSLTPQRRKYVGSLSMKLGILNSCVSAMLEAFNMTGPDIWTSLSTRLQALEDIKCWGAMRISAVSPDPHAPPLYELYESNPAIHWCDHSWRSQCPRYMFPRPILAMLHGCCPIFEQLWRMGWYMWLFPPDNPLVGARCIDYSPSSGW
jgi:hypothetical protein